jgi:Ca-activated chloride channel family protein
MLAALLLLVGATEDLAQGQNQTPAVPESQSPAGQPALEPPTAAGETGAGEGEARRLGDSWEAYEAEAYDQALQGFVDEQVERPEDPGLTFNIGSAHYKMKNYEEAERSFATVAMAGDPLLREQALYNLGNCAYRQGKLQEAVELYKAALEVDPDDEDAKFNLEFVRDEIRRRHEEQQKRQQEQQQQQDQDQDQDQQQQGQQQQQQQGGQDSDRDGLTDDTERSAQNPTDPHDADSDDDGLLDGQEDRNANGQVDDGETDPNNPDSDGDGKSDGQEALEQQDPDQQQDQQEQQGEPEDLEGLSREEAERYLQALEEGRPQQRQPHRGRPRRPAKDW